MSAGVKGNLIPIGPVRKALLTWERAQGYTTDDSRGQSDKPLAPIVRLSHYIDVKEDTLWAIRGRQSRQYVDFDLADKIISWIDSSLWQSDEELAAVYSNFDFTYMDERVAA